MKRITLIIFAVAAVLAGSVSCDKSDVAPKSSMPLVSMSIIPDFSDGSVYSYGDDGSFFLRVSVKPEKYIDKLLNNDGLICKADFRSVITKAIPKNQDFTAIGKITSASVEEGYLTASFTLSEDAMTKFQVSDYVVSFSINNLDNVHGVSTSYVPINNQRRGQGGDHQIQPDDPVGTIGMLDGKEGIVVELPALKKGAGNYAWKAEYDYPAKKVIIATTNEGAEKPEDTGILYEIIPGGDFDQRGWHSPAMQELYVLFSMSGIEWKDNGSKWTFNNGATALFLPKAEYVSKTYDYCQTYGGDTYFCISNKSNNVEITFYPNTYVLEVVCVRAFHDMP